MRSSYREDRGGGGGGAWLRTSGTNTSLLMSVDQSEASHVLTVVVTRLTYNVLKRTYVVQGTFAYKPNKLIHSVLQKKGSDKFLASLEVARLMPKA